MFETLLKLISLILNFWQSLPEEKKEEIIDAVAETFDAFFRAFFKANKEGEAQ